MIPKWHEFLSVGPTPADVRDRVVGDVVTCGPGLGYPRVPDLHRAAAGRSSRSHDGASPPTSTTLLALPGIGPYTARAVLAFAFEADVGVVDTNIAASARPPAVGGSPPRRPGAADRLVTTGSAWEWNQSMMDLGAALCRPVAGLRRSARSPTCRVAVAGLPAPDPAVGSAGVSKRQSRFEGSDRQGRGRLLDALRARGARSSRGRLARQPGGPRTGAAARAGRTRRRWSPTAGAARTAGDTGWPTVRQPARKSTISG